MFNLIKGTTGTCKTARMKMTIILKETFFTQVEQVVRKPNPRADRIFLKKEAFFHLRKHKNFSPVELMKKMEIANAPMYRDAPAHVKSNILLVSQFRNKQKKRLRRIPQLKAG